MVFCAKILEVMRQRFGFDATHLFLLQKYESLSNGWISKAGSVCRIYSARLSKPQCGSLSHTIESIVERFVFPQRDKAFQDSRFLEASFEHFTPQKLFQKEWLKKQRKTRTLCGSFFLGIFNRQLRVQGAVIYAVSSSSSMTRPSSSNEVTPFNIFTMPSCAIERIC
jgi:hypothetical protein